MGKVTKMLEKIRGMSHSELFARFKHIARAQAVREYLATKEDPDLTIEVNLTGEEIVNRMHSGHSYNEITTNDKKSDNK
jgi:hypothetical protein